MGQHSATATDTTQDTVAKVGFMAAMAAVMGPVGILIAALAVGVEEAWSGDAGRTASQELSRDRVEAERQWLAEDRAWRDRLRADRQRWINDGAKPETEPARSSKAEATGRFWRRLWARMVVWSDDFGRGFREGWAAAKQARADGADWLETARTRPEPQPVDQPAPAADDTVQAAPAPPAAPDVEPVSAVGGDPTVRPLALVKPTPSNTNPEPDPEGTNPMTTPIAAPRGESNQTVLGLKFRSIGTNLIKVEAGIDGLDKLADSLATQVREAAEFAKNTGQIAATNQASDSARAVVQRLRELVAQASDAARRAVDEVATARSSLKTAESAEDSITSAGGTGQAIATANAA